MNRDHLTEYKYAKAKKRVEKIKGFYIHVIVTVLIIPFLIFINIKFVPEFYWFWYPIIGMSVGLFFHWFGVYGADKLGLGRDWEERKIKQYLDEN